jgi:hypothetical protein
MKASCSVSWCLQRKYHCLPPTVLFPIMPLRAGQLAARIPGPNGTEGTDHGQGTVAFVLGGAVNGGRVIKHDTFSLAKADLVDGRDLKATLDTRQLFKGVLEDYLGVPRSLLNSTVFPESQDVLPIPDLIKSNPVATAPAVARSVAEPASSSLLPGIGVHRLKTGSFM